MEGYSNQKMMIFIEKFRYQLQKSIISYLLIAVLDYLQTILGIRYKRDFKRTPEIYAHLCLCSLYILMHLHLSFLISLQY